VDFVSLYNSGLWVNVLCSSALSYFHRLSFSLPLASSDMSLSVPYFAISSFIYFQALVIEIIKHFIIKIGFS